MKDTVQLQKNLFNISETSVKVDEIPSEDSKTEEIWGILDQNFSNVLPFVEETIDKWNSRTLIIKNLN